MIFDCKIIVNKSIHLITSPHGLAKKIEKKALSVLERVLIKTRSGKKAELSVADIILNNSCYGELLRCDIIVRYLAIEEYYGLNEYGFAMYKKMQTARLDKKRAEDAVRKFKELIRSYDENGYDKNSRIILDRNLKLIDGSHRLALALYHGISDINAQIINIVEDIEYSIDWFISNGFSGDEVDRIVTKYQSILQTVNNPFSCIIWSPARAFTDEVINDLKIYGEVISVKKYKFGKEEYINVVRAVYAIDDIEKWKIEKKLEHMERYSPECVAVDLRFSDPEYRIKKATGLLISKRGERVKRAIRNKYSKRIDNYFFDIIIHIGDNIYQSEYMRCVLEPGIDFKEMLGILDKYPYALAKVDVPYMPREFPNKIPIGKDVDVLCHKENIEQIKNEMVDLIRTYKEYDLVIKETPNGLKLRIVKGGY